MRQIDPQAGLSWKRFQSLKPMATLLPAFFIDNPLRELEGESTGSPSFNGDGKP